MDWISEPASKYANIVDFVGRFERLSSEFSLVQDRLGLDCALPNANDFGTRQPDYREVYTREDREIVSEIYARDISGLGYSDFQ